MKKKKRVFSPFPVLILSAFMMSIAMGVFFKASDTQHTTKKQVMAAAIVNCTIDPAKVAMNADEQAFLVLINAYRQQNNAGPLKLSSTLTQAAAWMANDSAVRNVLSHVDTLGRDPTTRMMNCGYAPPTTGSYQTGENVADGTPSENANQVFTAWKNSPEHNANMLNPAFTVIGIAKDSNIGDYWVNDFASFDDATTGVPTAPPTTTTVTPVLTNLPGGTGFSLTLCPHGLGKCGDNANPTSTGNTIPHHTTKVVLLTLLNTANQPVATQTGIVNYSGVALNFQGTIPAAAIPAGQYIAKVQMDGYLLQQAPGITTVTQGQTVAIPSISLVTGDTNNDNKLDVLDYNNIISCYGTKQNSAGCHYAPTTAIMGADINDDTVVNGGDYNLFLRELAIQKGN